MSLFSRAKSFFNSASDVVNGAWDYTRGKIDDLSDAIYGVMPSPVQNAVDKVGQPIAGVVNSVADKIDNTLPDWAQAAIKAGVAPWAIATLASPIALGIAGGAEALGALGLGSAAGAGAGAGSAAASSAAATAAPGLGATLGAGLASGLGSGIGSGLGAGIGSIIPAAASYAGAIDYNQTMRDTNRETNQTNMAIANQNLAFQRELQNYNKTLQQTIFNREDSSYQRTVNDMRAAGMSPLAMNGTNAAGEAIALGALNNQYQHTPLSDYKSPLDALANFNPIGFLSSLEDLRAKRLQNNLASETFDYNKARIKAESLLSQYSQMDASRREKFNSAFNLNSSMSEKEKMAQIISKLIGMPLLNKDGSPNMSLGDDLDKLLDRLSGSAPVKSAVDALSKIGSKKVAPAVNSSSSSSSSVKEPLNGTYDKKTGKYYSTRYHAWMDKKYGR